MNNSCKEKGKLGYLSRPASPAAIALVFGVYVMSFVGCLGFLLFDTLDNTIPGKSDKFVVKDKVGNSILVQNQKTADLKVIIFSQAYQDSIVYSNINVGDTLLTDCTLKYQKDAIVANLGSYDVSRIKRINGARTAKMIKKYEKQHAEVKKQKAISEKIHEQQMLHQYMQTKHKQVGRN